MRVTAEVVAGRPAKRIIRAAREAGTDLIVVGTEDRRGLARLLYGSVSEDVAARAHCSVSIVRGLVRGGGDRRGFVRARVPAKQEVFT